MKIAVTSTGPAMEDAVEGRFGRCAFYLIVDPDTMAFEAIANPNISQTGGAGTQSAQFIANQGVSGVLTGNCGPKASRVFEAAGIRVLTGINGKVGDAVSQFKSGGLPSSQGNAPIMQKETDPQRNVVYGGRGTGTGSGRGMGRGMGMGLGGGRGMGCVRGLGGGRGMGCVRGLGGGRRRSSNLGINSAAGESYSGTAIDPGPDEILRMKQTVENLRSEMAALAQKLSNIQKT